MRWACNPHMTPSRSGCKTPAPAPRRARRKSDTPLPTAHGRCGTSPSSSIGLGRGGAADVWIVTSSSITLTAPAREPPHSGKALQSQDIRSPATCSARASKMTVRSVHEIMVQRSGTSGDQRMSPDERSSSEPLRIFARQQQVSRNADFFLASDRATYLVWDFVFKKIKYRILHATIRRSNGYFCEGFPNTVPRYCTNNTTKRFLDKFPPPLEILSIQNGGNTLSMSCSFI